MSTKRRKITNNEPYMWLMCALLAVVGLAPAMGIFVSAATALLTNDHVIMNYMFVIIYLAAALATEIGAVMCGLRAYEIGRQRRASERPKARKTPATMPSRIISHLTRGSKSVGFTKFTVTAAALDGVATLASYLGSSTNANFDDYVAQLPWRHPVLAFTFALIGFVTAIGLFTLPTLLSRKQVDIPATDTLATGAKKQDTDQQV